LVKLIEKLQSKTIELRFVYEAGPCGLFYHEQLKLPLTLKP
jgi:hypothetical protein